MTWTPQEIKGYRPLEDSKLTAIYQKAAIPATDPEARARYLAEEYLGPQLTMVDHELIMRIAERDGKPAALNLLEKLAIAEEL